MDIYREIERMREDGEREGGRRETGDREIQRQRDRERERWREREKENREGEIVIEGEEGRERGRER